MTPPTATWRDRAMFVIRKFVIGYRISKEPHFDREATAHFENAVARSTNYLEYGSGGSTIRAWQSARTVVSVDNDRGYVRAVSRALTRSARRPQLSQLIHVHTGITWQYGIPVFKAPTPRRLQRWQRYATAPWEFLRAHAIVPDTILVDGRFRVACILESLLNLDDGSACVILVDDYLDRPEYSVVEAFADRVATAGRMVTLRKKPDFDRQECLRLLPHFQREWR
ncbi:MAG: hypothetical protein ABL961_00640 [Vicinamibacterales bacterium]